jgi:hypothetical protein
MKIENVFKGLLLGLTLLLATSMFAATNNNKGSLATMSDFTVNGKTLPAGEYQLKWEGSGPSVQLNIMKGKTVVATTPAHLVDLQQTSASDSAVLRDSAQGHSLAEVRFSGKKYALQIGDEAANSEAGGASK